jgi:hypothetical protein
MTTLTNMVQAENKRYNTFRTEIFCLLHSLRAGIKEDTCC